jgi:hypothetical protein
LPNLRQPRSAARCSVSPFAHLLSPTHSPKQKQNRLASPFGGSRLHHWLPWPCWVPKASIGRGSRPLPCAFCSFALHTNTEEGRAHHSNELFIATFFANFSERRLGEVGCIAYGPEGRHTVFHPLPLSVCNLSIVSATSWTVSSNGAETYASNQAYKVQTESLTLRRMAVDGLTGQAEGGRCPPAHAYAVRVFAMGRHSHVFLAS